MLYKTNGIVQSLTACSKNCPGFCQELNLNLTNANQQLATKCSASVHERTAMAGQSQCPKCRFANTILCYNKRKCNSSGAAL